MRTQKRGERKTKHRRIRLTKRGILLLDAILLIALAVSLFKLVSILSGYRKNAVLYRDLAAETVTEAQPSDPGNLPAPEETPASVADAAPSLPGAPVTVDVAALRAKNKDIVGWLYQEGTPVNYPVMQHRDNEYYLTRAYDGRDSSGGAIFMDCRNSLTGADQNYVLYGHRMKDDSMFGTLPDYSREAYLEKHPDMYFFTEDGSYRVEIFACRTVNADNTDYFGTRFSKDGFRLYLNKIRSQSYWTSEVPVSPEDKILTMVTCSTYTGSTNPRILVHGKLVPVG